MKVGIIGTNWGRTHVGTFRAHGHTVEALLGRDQEETRRIARAEGIPRATLDPEDLRDLDLIVIASPTATHQQYLTRFSDRPVLCEKPLCGTIPDPDWLRRLQSGPVYVNYAFPFLDTARLARHHIDAGHLGQVYRIQAEIAFNLRGARSTVDWLLDIAAHPLSFLGWVFGPFRMVQAHNPAGTPNLSAVLTTDRQTLNLGFYQAPWPSVRYALRFIGDRAEMTLEGAYHPGSSWAFAPLNIGGTPQNQGEGPGPEDVWYRANLRSVGTFLDVIEGRCTREQAWQRGLYDVRRASWIESALQPLLHP